MTSVTALAVRDDSLGEEIVVADTSGIWSVADSNLLHHVALDNVRCLYIDSLGIAYAGTNGQGLFIRLSLFGAWQPVANSESDTIVAMAGHDVEGVFALTNTGRVVAVMNGQYQVIAPTGRIGRSLCVDGPIRILVGTDAGIATVSNGQTLSDTIGPSTQITVQTPGGLTILERQGMNAPASPSWLGGTLLGPGLGSGVPITARVMDHVDSLQHIASAADSSKLNAYGESFIIRYGHENTDGLLDLNFPLYWLVYYTRGIGPVLIEEYMLGAGKPYTIDERATLYGK